MNKLKNNEKKNVNKKSSEVLRVLSITEVKGLGLGAGLALCQWKVKSSQGLEYQRVCVCVCMCCYWSSKRNTHSSGGHII